MVAPLMLSVGPLNFDAWADGPLDGEPVLLLHGFPESARCWRHVQPLLAVAGYRSVAPDLRGYSPGARPVDVAEYTMSYLVGDVLALADQLGWDRFHLVGHDWGGAVAWQVAGRHPDRIRTLTAVSTPHPGAFTAAKKAGASPDGDDQAAKSDYMQVFRSDGAEELFLNDESAVFRAVLEGSGLSAEDAEHYIARFDTVEALAGPLAWYRAADPADSQGMGPITVPTLYVWSTEDIALGRTAAELTGAQVDGPYTFEVLEGVSHWIPEMAADALGERLVSHLGGDRS
ncbi:MAG: alpha/beta hydrolase [Aquihabitans sp.]